MTPGDVELRVDHATDGADRCEDPVLAYRTQRRERTWISQEGAAGALLSQVVEGVDQIRHGQRIQLLPRCGDIGDREGYLVGMRDPLDHRSSCRVARCALQPEQVVGDHPAEPDWALPAP